MGNSEPKPGITVPGTIRCQFIGDNSVSVHHYCFPGGQFGVSSSLLLPWDNSVSVHQGQFGVSSSLLLPLHHRDNSVSVHHYCFPCIKSVSWIHGKTSKTDRRRPYLPRDQPREQPSRYPPPRGRTGY